jgi:hypothetical protein
LNKFFKSLLIITTLLSTQLDAITSINILKIGEKDIGLYGNIDLSLRTTRGNSETESYLIGVAVQKFNKRDLWLFNAKHYFEQSYSIKTANKSYLHIRNVREFKKFSSKTTRTDWEMFGQIEHNEFLKLEFRGLVGAGLRFQPILESSMFLGVGPMLVQEDYSDDTEGKTFGKFNFYLNAKSKVSDTTTLSYVIYYQPVMNEMGNFELVQSFELENRVTNNFSLVIKLSHDFDSNPIEDVEKYDFEQTTTFRYKF